MIPDFESSNQGSIVLLSPVTPAAVRWARGNILDPLVFAGAIAVEPRYFLDLALTILDEGMTIVDSATGAFAAIPQEG
jgi:hypothetical protein